jgi:DNA polymerase I-like protein with 3'-5' exonuclease and polymerase domains
MEELKSEAEKVMGHSIMLTSPKKISFALFVELKLSPEKSNKKSKGMSHQTTSESVLKSLCSEHRLPGIVLG